MRGDDDDGGSESHTVARRVLFAAGGAVLLTSMVAAITGEHDSKAHRAAGRADVASRPGGGAHSPTSPATPSPATPHPGATRPPRRPQPRLPYGKAMHTVDDGPKVVALTIDDGPSPVYTPQILAILHRYGITASFSMVGRNAAAFPGIAREVAAAGHMIVNHTWNHANLAAISTVAVQDEISRATDAIHAATGEHPAMFRAPYGVWPAAALRYCARAGLTPLAWSVDPSDWSRPGVRAIVRDIVADTRTGSIILEHDGGGNRSQTVAALKIWLPRLLKAGYQFTTP